MKISTKARYGLRAIIYLARHSSDHQVCPLSEIAEQQGIPFDYLEKIMAELREAGLVNSRRGAGGGYNLNGSPDQIEVGEVIRTLEDTSLIKCITGSCPREENCLAKGVWKKLNQTVNQALNSITLADLL